jgi:transposase
VGIDVSSKNNVAYIMTPDGNKHSSFSVPNNRKGATTLVENVASALSQSNTTGVVIGMESTSVYGDNLMYFLREDGRLGKYERKLHMLNPKQVRKFKESYSELPKNDFTDAFVIADHLRFGRIKSEVYMDDYRYQALKTLTRARHQTVEELTREKQRFLNHLFLKFSGLTQEKVFSDNFGAASLALIDEFESIDELAYMDTGELADFIRIKGKSHFDDVEKIAKAVKTAAKVSYNLPKTVAGSVNQVISISMATIRFMQKQIKEYDRAIEKQLETIPNTLTSIKGIGQVYAAGIIAETGDIKRFSGQAALAKYAGLSWTQNQSGDFEGEDTHLIKTGNRHLRYYLCEAANSLRKCDLEFKRYYSLKFKEVNKHQHKRAIALTARKLVRLVYTLLKTNRLYIPPEEY